MVSRNPVSHFNVHTYVVEGNPLLPTNTVAAIVSKYTGTNVGLKEIVNAAADLQLEYHKKGYPAICVAFVPEEIRDGVVTFNIAQSAISQIMVAGVQYLNASNGVEIAYEPSPVPTVPPPRTTAPVTNAPPPARPFAAKPATPEEMKEAAEALRRKLAELDAEAKDTRVYVVTTNAGPRFAVERYMISGNSVLTEANIGQAITNIDGAFGTNVSFNGIETVVSELGKAYHQRGYQTVKVAVPQQKLTNATVKLQVLEGRLADINVTGNRFFSSNNVMRALPSLHTNMVLNVPIFNAEIARANGNQDRQIYPIIAPGPEPGSSALNLNVKDRLPLHAKVDFNNENSPGTPDFRINSSAEYDNLWQLEHSLGVQYGFSPEQYKTGDQWDFYDQPVVAYYSAFYRMPLGNPEAIQNTVARKPDNFGYSEATRQFRLPPPSGQPELTIYGSRATVDTGVTTLSSRQITEPGSNPSIGEQDVEESPTVNQDIGGRLNLPLPCFGRNPIGLFGRIGLQDLQVENYKTNSFIITQTNYDANGNPILPPIVSTVPSPVPATVNHVEYLPLALRYDASWRDFWGTASFGLGLSANAWFDSHSTIGTGTNAVSLDGAKSLQQTTGSAQSSGYWFILQPSFSHDFQFHTNWLTSVQANGQWASEPLISTEQFGAGGVNSVRGYHEGEVFGDTGWRVGLEQQTPAAVIGSVYDGVPLTVRGSIYMDYARVYLLDPPAGAQGATPLWGTGFGFSAAAGSHWQARLLFSWPLLSAGSTAAYSPRFNFGLTAQF